MEGFLDDWNTAEKDSGSPDRSPEDFWELRIHMILTRENNSQHFTTCFYVPRMQKNEKLSNAKQLIGKNILNSIESKLQESLTAIGKNSNPLELND